LKIWSPFGHSNSVHESESAIKGGYAWADNQISATGFGLTFAETRFHSGGTVGAAFEYLFVPNWSAKVEYMYAYYTNSSYLTNFVPGGIGLGVSVNTVKAGINYHFGELRSGS
jgi:outer membrane immunogenic protein